ncbi:MAG: 16S rRNA (uracil(1498)-N(3))-methyltransferase [Alphaproteobacteria bacterium]
MITHFSWARCPRLYLNNSSHWQLNQTISLAPEQAHYLTTVMRLKKNDALRLFNGVDGEWGAIIANIGKKSLEVSLSEQLRPQLNTPNIWLLCALIRKTKMEWLLEKATELGAASILPVHTAFSQTHGLAEQRLQHIITEASEQTERLDIPSLQPLSTLTEIIANWPTGRILYMAAESGQAMGLEQAFAAHPAHAEAALLIGPEGGFSPAEHQLLQELPFCVPVNLGPRLLRSETAALAMLACWQAMKGDWQHRPPLREAGILPFKSV